MTTKGGPSTAGHESSVRTVDAAGGHAPEEEMVALEAERDQWQRFVARAEAALAAATEQVKAARERESQLLSRPVVDGDYDSLMAAWRPLHDVVVELEARETMLLAHVDALRPQAAQAASAVREAEERHDREMLTEAHRAWTTRVAATQRDFRRAVAEGWRRVPEPLRSRVTVTVSGATYAAYVAGVTELAKEADALRAWAMRHPAWQQGIPEPQTVHPETLLRRMLERGTIDDPDVDPAAGDEVAAAAPVEPSAPAARRPVPAVLPGAGREDGRHQAAAELAGRSADPSRRVSVPDWYRPVDPPAGIRVPGTDVAARAPVRADAPVLPEAASAVAPAAWWAGSGAAGASAPPPPSAPPSGRSASPEVRPPAPAPAEPLGDEPVRAGRRGVLFDHRVTFGPRRHTPPDGPPPQRVDRRRRLILAAVGAVAVGTGVAVAVDALHGSGSARPAPSRVAQPAPTLDTPVTAAPPPAPPVRTGASVAPTGPHAALLFGGRAPDGSPLADTWILGPGGWTALHPAVSPTPRHSGALAWDPVTRTAILVGGVGALERPLADEWTWDGTTWSPLHPRVAPPAVPGSVAVWDGARGVVLLLVPLRGHVDTWTWNGHVWHHLVLSHTPMLAVPFTAGFDPTHRSVLAIGTPDGRAGRAATWTWDGTRWTLHRVVETPLTVDPRTALAAGLPGGVLLVQAGGAGGATWHWDGSGWTPLSPTTLPALPAGAGALAVADGSAPAGALLVAPGPGGVLGAWTWNGTGWAQS